MTREAVSLLVVTLVLFGGLAAWAVVGQTSALGADGETAAALTARLDDLGQQLHATRSQLTRADQDRRQLAVDLSLFSTRLAALEAGGPGFGEVGPIDVPVPGLVQTPAATADHNDPDALETEFADLLALGILDDFGNRATPDQEARFWELARTTNVLSDLIDNIEAALAADPGNAELRMELADAYVTKLLTVPAGPERGVWGVKAEQQWKDVAAANPQHWESEFRLGVNYSYYPSFLNKTGEAIAGMERARAILANRPAEPRHVQTYIVLSRLYDTQGDGDKARAALLEGLNRHPGDADLAAALAALP